MSRQETKLKKLAVLETIKEKKGVLFGNFTGNEVTREQKEKAWQEVLRKAQSLELAGAEKHWTYARDNLFGLWKSRTLNKRNNSSKSGAKGGKQNLLDEVDHAILDLIEQESPVVEGLKLPESYQSCDGASSASANPQSSEVSRVVTDNMPGTSEKGIKKSRKRKCSVESSSKDSANLENTLKCELLKVEIYHKKLKCLKLERELNVPQSAFTKDIEQVQILMPQELSGSAENGIPFQKF